jgi:imidazoleglycerol-phosphate dehydratase
MGRGTPEIRYAEVERETRETRVQVVLDLDGGSRQDVTTGIGFLDHMLCLVAFHGKLNLGIKAEGDLQVDDHHTVEDVGIVLGKAFREAVHESEPVVRYGSVHQVMDEALVLCALDISGRGHYHHNIEFKRERLGELSTESIHEFFRAFCLHGGVTMHFQYLAGVNDHHLAEAMFKGFGRALHVATRIQERPNGATSTKGKID